MILGNPPVKPAKPKAAHTLHSAGAQRGFSSCLDGSFSEVQMQSIDLVRLGQKKAEELLGVLK